MNFLTALLNRFRYRRGRAIDASYAMGHGPQVEIMENDLAANGVIRWRIVRSCGWTGETWFGEIETGTPEELRSRVTELKEWPAKLAQAVQDTEEKFMEALRCSVRNFKTGQFALTITECKHFGDIPNGDDGAYETTVLNNQYIEFIRQLLDCWVDSIERPGDYPNLSESDWVNIAESLLSDIDHLRAPTHELWNEICTVPCRGCHKPTSLENGIFLCIDCDITSPFRFPKKSASWEAWEDLCQID